MSPKTRVRAAGRHVALDLAATRMAWGDRLERVLATPRVHNLYLHAVEPPEEGRFRELLQWLVATGHTLIPYGEGIRRVEQGDIDRPYVTFSFDDGFASNVDSAAILEEFGTRGCFFVITDFIGSTDIADARRELGAGITEPAMSWNDVEGLRSRGHEIGNHTRNHRRLSDLEAAEVADQVGAAGEVLRRRFGSVEHFAWPFGRWFHFSPLARRIVFDAEHRSCASAERGAHGHLTSAQTDHPRAWCPRRDHVVTSWPMRHLKYFVAKSAAEVASGRSSSGWPSTWEEHE